MEVALKGILHKRATSAVINKPLLRACKTPSGISARSYAKPTRNARRQFVVANASAQSDRQDFTVTTPLYYVNAAPHMGSAYPTIAADVLARFQRLKGKRVRFITGTDEHGEKIAIAAEKRGMSPQEHCDSIVNEYKSLWKLLDIEYDSFVRTTDKRHEALVTQILDKVWEKGDIYKGAYSGYYCVDCEEYKEEKELDAEHNCPVHRKPCNYRNEENYFFKLTNYQNQLSEILGSEDCSFVQPTNRLNEVLGWVNEGVVDFSISRAAVEWGIDIPRDPKQTVYVWFDALNGYLSGLLPEGVDPTPENLAAHGWPADVHIIGKDILRFHAVYWPAMLMSSGLPLPKMVYGHGFLTKDGLKMGKSLGNVLDPVALTSAYGSDAVRFYFMKEIAFGQDGNFSEAVFRDIVNAGLANTIGNMLNRGLNLLKKYSDSKYPVGAQDIPEDHPLRAAVSERIADAETNFGALQFHRAAESLVALGQRGNVYLEEVQPWTALKKGTDEEKQAALVSLVAVCELSRILAVALSPITPQLAQRIYQQLGLSDTLESLRWSSTAWGVLQAGAPTGTPAPVFARIETDKPFVTEPAPVAVTAPPSKKEGKKKAAAAAAAAAATVAQ